MHWLGIGFLKEFQPWKLYFRSKIIGPRDCRCAGQPGSCFPVAVKHPVIACNLEQRIAVARIQLSSPLEASCGLFPASLAPLDIAHHRKYPSMVGQGLTGNLQFSQRAIEIAITSIKMYCSCVVCFARIWTDTQCFPDSCFRHGQARRSTVKLPPVKRVMSEGELAIRLEK